MFEKFFKDPAAIARHRNAPYAKEREQYLAHCVQEGYAHTTLVVIACDLLWIARKLNVYPELRVSSEQIKAAAKGWAQRERCVGRTLNVRWTCDRFIRVARHWLRFLGCLDEPVAEHTTFLELVEDFNTWMENERGLAPSTIRLWSRRVEKFLRWYEARKRPIADVQVSDVDSFLEACGRRGCCRLTVAAFATCLRAFFRYAGVRRWCRPSIAEAIQAPPVFSHEALPSGPSWEDVGRLFAGMETERPSDIRDRAILMLFAVYGLRRSEVSKLRIEDIDWENDHILVPRAKRRESQMYPLIPTVGNAIAQYLKDVRPQCARREVFLTLHAPLRPISGSGLYSLTSSRMLKLGIPSRRRGPHSLRHACAGHLVSEGFSLKEIGDHLGHRSSCATRIYAKVDLPGLREAAAFDLGGLL